MTDTTTAAWDQFIHWAEKVYALEYFADAETNNKLAIADRIAEAKDAFNAQTEDWFRLLKRSFTYQNYITSWRQHGQFLTWIQEHREGGTQALTAIWDSSIEAAERFTRFEQAIPRSEKVTSTNLASFLHMVNDPTAFPPFRAKQVNDAYKLTGFDGTSDSTIWSQYSTFLTFLDTFIQEAEARGLAITNRLDAQGLMWSITYHDPHEPWSDEDKRAFRQYRGLAEPSPTNDIDADETPSADRQAILDAMATFDAELRDSPEWAGWEGWRNYKFAILHEGRHYPVKQIYSMATGKPVTVFISTQARAYIAAQEFEIVALREDGPSAYKIAPGHQASEWTDCLTGGYMCVGWDAVGDLTRYESFEDFREAFDEACGEEYGHKPHKVTEKAKEIWLLTQMEPGDLIVANKGKSQLLGIGTVKEPVYVWREDRHKYRHTITVDWDTSVAGTIPAQERWAFQTILPITMEQVNDLLASVKKTGPYTESPFSAIIKAVADEGFRIEERRLRQYHLALKTRGFVILAGPSGTGKTWLTKVYADAVGARHEIVAVAPNWTTNEDLLGFHNPMTGHFHDTAFTRFLDAAALAWDTATAAGMTAQPFHLVLDEMNLARVEYYFAEFLSRMELRARGEEAIIPLGPDRSARLTPNLCVIGTVNIDETTHGFADKVYDRAQLLVLDVTRDEVETHLVGKEYADHLLRIWEITAPYKPFAFRVLDEIGAYIDEAKAIGLDWPAALDDQVLHKILPKLNGHDPALGTVLAEVVIFLQESYPLSHAHASRMLQDYTASGLASYFH